MAESFLLTGELREHLDQLRAAFGRPSGSGAFVIGAYGSGKSHLLAWLARQAAAGAFWEEPPEVVPLTMLDWPATTRLEDAVSRALGVAGDGERPGRWARWHRDHPRGALLLVDELSEFLRSKPDPPSFNEDVRFLQFLGEWAQRHSLWIVAAMQEQIEHTGEIEHGLYRKIQDRFPLRIPLTPSHVRDLIAYSVLVKGPGYDAAVDDLVAGLRKALPQAPIDWGALRECYPLHPVTLDLLEEVRDRFSRARGAVDFATVQLQGDPTRGVEPFLDRPWGELLTPDRIVAHFMDVLERQHEFRALADRVLPFWNKRLPELFEKPRLAELARSLLRLLVLCWLSPRREGLSAEEATTWLLFAASKLNPAQNAAIVKSALDRMVDEGRFLLREGDGAAAGEGGQRYRLAPGDDAAAELERAIEREVQEVAPTGAALWEAVLPLLPGLPEALALPRDAWQVRPFTWFHHERRVAVWVGNGLPTTAPVEPALVVRLPWEGAAAPGFHLVVPEVGPAGDDHRELVALARLADRPWRPAQEEALRHRRQERARRISDALIAAFRDARVYDTRGTALAPARGDPSRLDAHAERALRLHYPKFESVAPSWGPLPNATWAVWMRTGGEPDGGDGDHQLVRTVREGYLERMGALRREGGGLVVAEPLDRLEPVRRLLALAAEEGPPRAIYDELGKPPWGLVTHQVTALLALLVVRGDVDVVRDGRSWRETAHTLPGPEQYDRVTLGKGLDAQAVRGLQAVVEALELPHPQSWTASAQRAAVEQLGRHLGGLVQRAGALRTEGLPGSESFAEAAGQVDADLALLGHGFDHLLHHDGPPAALAERLADFARWCERLSHQLPELRRLHHLQPAAKLPDLAEPDAVDAWLGSARDAWTEHARRYRTAHAAWWDVVRAHPALSWKSPAAAALSGVGVDLDRVDRQRARIVPCALSPALEFEPRCTCGFDGVTAPAAEDLHRLTELQAEVERELSAFFAQRPVRAGVREARKLGIVPPGDARDYLEGGAPWPEVADPALLEAHLQGVEVVANVPASRLLERLRGRTWTRAELSRAFTDFLDGLPHDRMRLADADPDEGAIVAWAASIALRHGEPLPPALWGHRVDVDPREVTQAALDRLDDLGLADETVDQVLRWVADGVLSPTSSRCAPVAAAIGLHRPVDPLDADHLARSAALLYDQDERMRRLFGPAWDARLERLAGATIDAPPVAEVLQEHDSATWWIVDALGLALWPAVRAALGDILPGWHLLDESVARSPATSTTRAFQDSLLARGLEHTFHMTDAVDHLLHERAPAFPDLCRLAVAELAGAGRQIARRADPRRPLVLTADHGFRRATGGRGWVHGGPSALERLVPVAVFRAG